MRVLVAVASKHGSTAEIAERIATGVRAGSSTVDAGIQVDVRSAGEVASIDGYDAIVLGSAVYAGHWLAEAREFASEFAAPLAARPVFLFSSGPVGDPPKPEEEPVDVTEVLSATKAIEHRIFAGRVERRRLGFAEKAIVMALRVPDGDFRPWAEIDAWAATIAAAVRGGPAAAETAS